ncbi:MAG: nitroreductase family deazaflavin-dependent oxidoreductase [Steroidobacteraceae bacterium]|nr:nitroreductase family deazaflavin-dependent oxidoreductase [Steroidobacteraceae bacterium]MDW8259907.1 nitroreductase family deazaflavin-dependent oxidoreductase [Gammaproteobacteria bacterium]
MRAYVMRPDDLDWTQKHLRRYLETNGEEGYLVDFRAVGGPAAVPTLILTTTGRRSGKPQSLPLIFGEDAGRYVIIASKGGAPEHPAWFRNLLSNPDAEVQIRSERIAVRARVAEGEERARLWRQMAATFPSFDKYQARTTRQIPVVVLERRAPS